MDATALVQAAVAAREKAYAPYSGYLVGAAILGSNGRVYTGCNVENASYGATLCAERVALGTMVAAGVRSFAAIAVATENGGPPCGICRQSLAEFGPEAVVLSVDASGHIRRATLSGLLPDAFDAHDLERTEPPVV